MRHYNCNQAVTDPEILNGGGQRISPIVICHKSHNELYGKIKPAEKKC